MSIFLKFEKYGFTIKFAEGIANSVVPDQPAPKEQYPLDLHVCPDLSVQKLRILR